MERKKGAPLKEPAPIAYPRVLEIPAEASRDEVYDLSLRVLKGFLAAEELRPDLRMTAVKLGLQMGSEDPSLGARKVEGQIDQLMSRVFGEPVLRAVGES